MRPAVTDLEGSAWGRLGIRVDDLRDAERFAERLGRSEDERRRALVTTVLPPALALLLTSVLAVVLAAA